MKKKTASNRNRASRKTVAVSLDIELVEKLQKVAEKLHRSVSSVVDQSVRYYLPFLDSGVNPELDVFDCAPHLQRLLEASITPELQKQGIRPFRISVGRKGVSIDLFQYITEDGEPTSYVLEDTDGDFGVRTHVEKIVVDKDVADKSKQGKDDTQ